MVSTDGLAGARQRHQLGVHRLDLVGVLVGQLEVDTVVLLEHRQHLEAAATARAAAGLVVVGDVLELAQHETRHHQGAVQEARGDHVHEAAVDDGAGVEVGDGCGGVGTTLVAVPAIGRLAHHQARVTGSLQQVLALGHGQAHHAQPQHDRDAKRQQPAKGSGRLASGRPSSRPISRPSSRPRMAVTNSPVESSPTPVISQRAGTTVMYGRMA